MSCENLAPSQRQHQYLQPVDHVAWRCATVSPVVTSRGAAVASNQGFHCPRSPAAIWQTVDSLDTTVGGSTAT